MAALLKPTYTKIDPKTGRRITKKSRKWYGQYVDADGATRRVPLCTDKAASQAMLNELVVKAHHRQAGLSDPFEQHRKQALFCRACNSTGIREKDKQECDACAGVHLSEFRKDLSAKGNTKKHVQQTINRLRRLFEGCRFRLSDEIFASGILQWLSKQREADEFGIKTSNYYLAAAKEFCGWMVREKRMSDNPLVHLQAMSAETDVRRERRSLSAREFARLLKAACDQERFRDLAGSDREVLYTMAAYTGLRASELASLTLASLDFEADPATVTVEAAYSKHRRRDLLPLHPDLANRLKNWLCENVQRQRSERLWPGTWKERAAVMLKRDLKAAKIPYIDEAGRVFDFHALRGQFVTELGRQGVTLQEAQKLARHSDPKLTANYYTHLSMSDLASAVDNLPTLKEEEEHEQETALQATGTDGELALQLALTSDFSCPRLSSDDMDEPDDGGRGRRRNLLRSKPLGNDCHQEARVVTSSGGGTRTPDTRIMIPLL